MTSANVTGNAPNNGEAILVAGVGNIFLGDDAFGVEVARSLLRRKLPPHVQVKDFGIRGFDLAYTLLEPWRAVILVDAMPRRQPPGTLFILEPDLSGLGNPATPGLELNPHGMDPMRVLNLALSLGPVTAQIYVVGCEPHDFGEELEGRMGLSPQVQAVVEDASNMVEKLVERIVEHIGGRIGERHPGAPRAQATAELSTANS